MPALVDEETFAAAQEQLAENRARHGRPAVAGRYLLQGLVVCCCCGCAYCGKHYRGKKRGRSDSPTATTAAAVATPTASAASECAPIGPSVRTGSMPQFGRMSLRCS